MKKVFIFIIIFAILTSAGYAFLKNQKAENEEPIMESKQGNSENLKKATFAGGCFWCMEPPYEKLKGVVSVVSGYTGGTKKNPTYEEVSSGMTKHAEAVEVLYDNTVISYEELLDVFWRNIDPTTPNKQFADVGSQYRTAIFYHDDEQKKLALASKEAQEKSGRYKEYPIVTEIVSASEFYPAEDYHQDYYKKNALHYKLYRTGSGRDAYLEKIWGKQK